MLDLFGNALNQKVCESLAWGLCPKARRKLLSPVQPFFAKYKTFVFVALPLRAYLKVLLGCCIYVLAVCETH